MAHQLQLKDGRIVDYLVSGTDDGFPLVWIHGTPGAYLIDPTISAAIKNKAVKVITLSRAGYGGSSRNRGRSVVDAVADIQALLENLNIKRFLVGGASGGGPHALACAARLPGCIAVLSVAGVAPYDAEGLDFLAGQGEDNVQEFNAAIKGEEEVQRFCNAMRPEILQADIEDLIKAMSSNLPEVDKKAMSGDTEMADFMTALFQESLRLGCDGWVDDDLAFVKPWGFEFSEIKVPVILYQGSEDKMVPYAHGEWLAEHLPQDKLKKHLLPDEGHVSILTGFGQQMMDELLSFANL